MGFSPAAPFTLFGLRLGFSGPQASHDFGCEPPASSHVKRVNARFRVRLGFLDLITANFERTDSPRCERFSSFQLYPNLVPALKFSCSTVVKKYVVELGVTHLALWNIVRVQSFHATCQWSKDLRYKRRDPCYYLEPLWKILTAFQM